MKFFAKKCKEKYKLEIMYFTRIILFLGLTKWGGALRDETNNGCVGDYGLTPSFLAARALLTKKKIRGCSKSNFRLPMVTYFGFKFSDCSIVLQLRAVFD